MVFNHFLVYWFWVIPSTTAISWLWWPFSADVPLNNMQTNHGLLRLKSGVCSCTHTFHWWCVRVIHTVADNYMLPVHSSNWCFFHVPNVQNFSVSRLIIDQIFYCLREYIHCGLLLQDGAVAKGTRHHFLPVIQLRHYTYPNLNCVLYWESCMRFVTALNLVKMKFSICFL
jgi:hypothetical protein